MDTSPAKREVVGSSPTFSPTRRVVAQLVEHLRSIFACSPSFKFCGGDSEEFHRIKHVTRYHKPSGSKPLTGKPETSSLRLFPANKK